MGRRPAPAIDGVAVIDKAPGWTSHDVVAKARGVLGTRKVGHSGTLDPGATGVLVLGVGRATRLLRFLTALSKSYVGEMVLGSTTNTLDAAGEVTGTFAMDGTTLEDVRRAAAAFVGEIQQVPPMVSALKVGGQRLHELARAGIEVERAPRAVRIERIDVEPAGEDHVFRLSVQCGSGTYIRSLAADIGTALGGGAHLRNLRRTAVGGFTLADAHTVEDAVLLPMREVLRDQPRITVDAAAVADLLHGRRIEAAWPTAAATAELARPPQVAAVYGPDDELVAVVEPAGSQVKPVVVVARSA